MMHHNGVKERQVTWVHAAPLPGLAARH
eukprot:COSAG02_NODE_58868_length_276_cov_0.581921_1_plen_27_part_10